MALAMMQVICSEQIHDADFVGENSIGFEALSEQVHRFTPEWAYEFTGIAAERIRDLARRYAGTRAGMIVLGGSSLHKGDNGSEAICCPHFRTRMP